MAQLSSPEGLSSLREAAQAFAQAGSAGWQVESLYWLAIGERRAQRLPEALVALQSALAIHASSSAALPPEGFYSAFEAQLLLGELQAELGDHAAAERSLTAARRLATESSSRWSEWRSVDALAQLNSRRGQPQAARVAWAEARSIVAQESPWGLGQVCKRWADFEATQGATEAARALYAESVAAHRKAIAGLEGSAGTPERERLLERNRGGAAQALLALTRLEIAQRDDEAAARACSEGLELVADSSAEPERSEGASTARDPTGERRELLGQLTELQREIADRRRPKAASAEERAAIRRVNESKVAVRRSLLEQLRRAPEQLASAAKLVPELRDGKLIGLRVFGVRDDTLWGLLGIRNGDRLLTLNGVDVLSLPKSPEAVARLKAAKSYRVALVRAGTESELEIVEE